MNDTEALCEEVWFLCDKEWAKSILKDKTIKINKYERNLLNHVVLNDFLVEYEEESKTLIQKFQHYLDKIFSVIPFLN